MEDEKKKKKNKKKKNKQNKSAIDNTNSVGGLANADQNQASVQDHQNSFPVISQVQNVDQNHSSVQDNQNHDSGTTQVENEVPKIDVELDLGNRLSNGGECVVLEETVETSQRENDPPSEQQVVLEEISIGLQNEHDIHISKETSLESKLLQLEKEKDSWLLKQDGLDEKIQKLQEENEIHLHKEASFEWKLLQLEKEIDDGFHKQAHLEEEFHHLVERTDSLSSKEASLEEKVKQLETERDSWLEKEKSTKEIVANLNGNVCRLETQVMELEESRNSLLRENQRLEESISGLQFQIQNLEEHVASAVLSCAPRTVNDLYIKSDPQSIVNNDFQDAASESTVEISEQFGNVDSTFNYAETTSQFTDRVDFSKDILIQEKKNRADDLMEKDISLPVKTIESFEDVAIQSEGEDHKNIYPEGNIVISDPSYTNGIDEIVQISLDENHAMGPAFLPRIYEEKTDIPLSDSPLIGAPFRLVSFFTRYVSGADLLNKG